ncbi:unnamed protein product [Phytophthora fragariaefolia]|uniref:Unnamed protein product n=1 Tax=Phytophthora fragariaefolia TaxID=1490495 RepID=A0A9W6XTD9_9STRA|nr:unnamed protein product [Phytophthora fragariaefolia]
MATQLAPITNEQTILLPVATHTATVDPVLQAETHSSGGQFYWSDMHSSSSSTIRLLRLFRRPIHERQFDGGNSGEEASGCYSTLRSEEANEIQSYHWEMKDATT